MNRRIRFCFSAHDRKIFSKILRSYATATEPRKSAAIRAEEGKKSRGDASRTRGWSCPRGQGAHKPVVPWACLSVSPHPSLAPIAGLEQGRFWAGEDPPEVRPLRVPIRPEIGVLDRGPTADRVPTAGAVCQAGRRGRDPGDDGLVALIHQKSPVPVGPAHHEGIIPIPCMP